VRNLIEGAHDEAWEILVQYRDLLDAMVLELAEKETLTKEDLERILAPVRKRPPHNSFSGFGKRTPSDRPPIEIPPSVRRAAANGANGANGNGAYAGAPGANGNGWNQPAPAGTSANAAGAPGPSGYNATVPAPTSGPPAYGQPAYGQPAYGQPAYGQPAYGQPANGQPAPYGTQPGTPDADGFSAPQYNQPQTGEPNPNADNRAPGSTYPPPPGYPSYPERGPDPDGGARESS
jgi:cell division protease FtsH